MKLRELALATVTGAFVLGACGGGETTEVADDPASAVDVVDALQAQAEKAQDVEIKDKKSLNKNERIANTYLKGINEIVTALEAVDDEASAERAAEVMANVGQQFDTLSDEVDGSNRERAIAMAMASRQQEFMAVQQRMVAAMMRIQMQNPELMKTVSDGMDKAKLP
ncbi:hypothetical protein ACFFUB_10930 [Algimonas porphyrae]|uniref:Secreted protein n=1 Tax=Algimonas porphyrae TaxID=1128113 RepID=A0ABQ5V333_9PROT|nr:hypothetical protein [Algimonas porphyrae]GLQ21369.1 hypothetical protein GCM10007854_23240 [Algimonas porphyrae]